MNQYNLIWNEAMDDIRDHDTKSKPSVKTNYNAIAKISDKDKQAVQT
jgi:hypothetical protein